MPGKLKRGNTCKAKHGNINYFKKGFSGVPKCIQCLHKRKFLLAVTFRIILHCNNFRTSLLNYGNHRMSSKYSQNFLLTFKCQSLRDLKHNPVIHGTRQLLGTSLNDFFALFYGRSVQEETHPAKKVVLTQDCPYDFRPSST